MLKSENTINLNFVSINNADIGLTKEKEISNQQNNEHLSKIAFQLEKIIFQLNNGSNSEEIISQLKNIVLNIYKTINENIRVSFKASNNCKNYAL